MTNRHAVAGSVGTVWVHPGEAVTNYTITALHPNYTNITASADLVVADIALEPITTERLSNDRLYNPCSVPLGEYRRFKVKVEAAADAVPDTDIDWELPPNVTLRPGLSGGRIVELTAEAAGTNTVTVHIADFAGQPPQLSFAGHTPTNIPVRFMIVCDQWGTNPATTPQNCSNLVWNANRILDQVGITLVLEGITHTNRQDWYELDPMNNTTTMQLLASLPSGNGFEVYIVNEFSEFYGNEIGGFNMQYGSAVKGDSSARTLAHEILHQCGLEDIYYDMGGVSLSFSTTLLPANLPADFTGAKSYYPDGFGQREIVQRLLMGPGSDSLRADIPLGRIFGVGYLSTLSGVRYYEKRDLKVGFSDLDSPLQSHQ